MQQHLQTNNIKFSYCMHQLFGMEKAIVSGGSHHKGHLCGMHSNIMITAGAMASISSYN